MIEELRDNDGLPAFAMAGYSLGGNLTLKLAGEAGRAELPELKAVRRRVAGDRARSLHAGDRAPRRTRIYEWNFCRNLQGRMRRKERLLPGVFNLEGLWKVWSIRAFDDRYTAPAPRLRRRHPTTTTAPAPCA